MTAIYLVPLVETQTVYKDHTVTERVPAGCEEVEPGRVWKTLNAGGAARLLSISTPLASLPRGAQQLTSAKGERLTAQTVGRVGNVLGKNLDTTRHRDLPTLLADLLVTDAERPLQPSRNADGSREIRIQLVDETIVIPVPSGGAEITDDFSGTLSAWQNSAWYGPNIVEIISGELGCLGANGSDTYAGRHLTALSSADHYVQAPTHTIIPDARQYGLMVRMSDNDAPSSGYQGGIDAQNGEYAFWEIDTGYGRTQLASAATYTTIDKVLRVEANGSGLEIFYDGASVLTTTDATYTDPYIGAWFRVNDDFWRITEIEASPLGAPAATSLVPRRRRPPFALLRGGF